VNLQASLMTNVNQKIVILTADIPYIEPQNYLILGLMVSSLELVKALAHAAF
jgi:hypothetical protein